MESHQEYNERTELKSSPFFLPFVDNSQILLTNYSLVCKEGGMSSILHNTENKMACQILSKKFVRVLMIDFHFWVLGPVIFSWIYRDADIWRAQVSY